MTVPRSMFIPDEQQWAQALFSSCQLGDARRTKRLVDYAARQATHAHLSTLAACQGDEAAALGAYRFLRNEHVDPDEIHEGAFRFTAQQVAAHEVLLALEDTTALSFQHSVRAQLGDLGGKASSRNRGWFAHSVLLLDAETDEVVGLIAQQRWMRRERGRKHKRKERPYQEKESFKWQQASEAMARRLGDDIARVISVCDREADVYEYVHYKLAQGQRFVVRAGQDRRLAQSPDPLVQRLWPLLAAQPVWGHRLIEIQQRGGAAARSKRSVCLSVRAAAIVLKAPQRRKAQRSEGPLPPLPLWAIYAREEAPPAGVEAMEWLLLTSEPTEALAAALRLLRYYSKRPRIEEFHKAWKSGCRVEARRMQQAGNLERIAVILAHIAVRLLQLHDMSRHAPERACTAVLSAVEWQCLWKSTEGGSFPGAPPSVAWAERALARLGGWQDTKRTGRVGWEVLWRGWLRLQERVEGWRLAQESVHDSTAAPPEQERPPE